MIDDWIKVEKKTNSLKLSVDKPKNTAKPEQPLWSRREPKRLNYDTLGGNLASMSTEDRMVDGISEEPLVDNLTAEHISNQCSVYLA